MTVQSKSQTLKYIRQNFHRFFGDMLLLKIIQRIGQWVTSAQGKGDRPWGFSCALIEGNKKAIGLITQERSLEFLTMQDVVSTVLIGRSPSEIGEIPEPIASCQQYKFSHPPS